MNLWQRYQDLQKNHRVFTKEGAAALGVSELMLLGSAPDSVYLGSDGRAVLRALDGFSVKSIVRNEACVHEMTGRLGHLDIDGMVGMALGQIDLRLFFKTWAHALYHQGCVAFFDDDGCAVLKFYLKQDGFNAQSLAQVLPTLNPPKPDTLWSPRAPSDTDKWQHDWQNISSVHDFAGLLKTHGIDKLSAYHHAPTIDGQKMAKPLPKGAIFELFMQAKRQDVPLMIFVGNGGAMQIYQGKPQNITLDSGFINIFNANFSLHLHDDTSPWLSKRADTWAIDGFFNGQNVISIFAYRAPKQAVDEKGNALLQSFNHQ